MTPSFFDNQRGEALLPHGDLIYGSDHPPLLAQQRANLMLSRVHLLAGLFAVFTLLWLLIDALVFPRDVWLELTSLRLLVCLAFVALTRYPLRTRSAFQARIALAVFIVIPLGFFALASPAVHSVSVTGIGKLIAATYAYIPFIVMACLAMFPLTALEGLMFACLVIGVHVGLALFQPTGTIWGEISAAWLLLLIALIATVSAMTQLHYMIALLQRASRDPLTGAYNRETGAELLDMQFHIATRQGGSLALAFLDIDDFKSINDRFGHEAGDEVLRSVAQALHATLRAGDTLVRWGGEEFLVIFPNTDCATAQHALSRIYARGLGRRPDGQPLTASAGISELNTDRARTTHTLVERADRRMYQAKRKGKACFIACGEASAGDQLQAHQ